MPCGPTNAPTFYSATMSDFEYEWDTLFIIRVKALSYIDGEPVPITDSFEIFVGNQKITSGTKKIIDDILIYCRNKFLILLHLECICMIFCKYRVINLLDKYEFLKDKTEHVGHDITSDGNCPAQSKFDMINDWKQPLTGQSIFPFVGLINLYHQSAPYLELELKPLHRLCCAYYQQPITMMSWTPYLIDFFHELKVNITPSTVLSRFDNEKPTFLKNYWSAEGMGWILMQPADDEESQESTAHLRNTGECLFDFSKHGARLKPVAFESCSYDDMESKYHSVTG